MSAEAKPTEYTQPELQLNEPVFENLDASPKEVEESQVALNGLKEWAGTWVDHFKHKRSVKIQPVQPELPFDSAPPQPPHELGSQPSNSSKILESAASRLERKIEFRKSLGEWALAKVSGEQTEGPSVKPKSRSELRAENKVLKKIEKAKIKTVAVELEDVIHGGEKKGKYNRRATKHSQKEAIKELRRLRAEGEITGEQYFTELENITRIREFKDSRAQSRARRAARNAERDIVIDAAQPRLTTMQGRIEKRLRSMTQESEVQEDAVTETTPVEKSLEDHSIDTDSVTEVHLSEEVFVDWENKLSPSNVQNLRKRIDWLVKSEKQAAKSTGTPFNREATVQRLRTTETAHYLGVEVKDITVASIIDPSKLDKINTMLDMDWNELQSLVDEEKPKPSPKPTAKVTDTKSQGKQTISRTSKREVTDQERNAGSSLDALRNIIND